MTQTERRPAGRVAASPDRASESVFTDSPDNITIPLAIGSTAGRWLARRFGLSPQRAALLASLAGIGSNIAPALPALICGAS